MNEESMEANRDSDWLAQRVALIWENHFADVAQGYPITVRFGTRAQYRFGSITCRHAHTIILVNRLFAHPYVPVYVIDGTLAHELAHYAHGFGSGLPRLYVDPHRGGIVDRELEIRGLGELDRKADAWREAHWDAFYNTACSDIVARKSSREAATSHRWDRVLCAPGCRSMDYLNARLAVISRDMGCARPPFAVEWLRATTRQTATSYWFPQSMAVRLHGLLADRRVPTAIVDFEIAYWVARLVAGRSWSAVETALRASGLAASTDEALRWRNSAWKAFRNRHHPLR